MTQIGKYPSTYYRVSLKAFVRDEKGCVLVCKEDIAEHWNLPGGGLDHGETEEECLKRELYEEIGYKGNISFRPIATQVFYIPSKDVQLLWVVYDVKLDHIVDTIGEHGTAVAYIDPEEFKSSQFGTIEQAQAAIYKIHTSFR